MQEEDNIQVDLRGYIVSTPDVLRGKPRIKGTRIPVSLILGYLIYAGKAEKLLAVKEIEPRKYIVVVYKEVSREQNQANRKEGKTMPPIDVKKILNLTPQLLTGIHK